ncbi:MAG: 3-deoxy-manno-octulosonate cytidylyltransferase [Pyrinomonadaceae bacterium]|nr:3-deoxy-manno-octulosonate cytidylyltransferase [Pyrinomonadaceae bacterium]
MCRPVNNAESHSDSKTIAIIPARYHATRLPGKPLLEIAGRPMILHTVERALAAPSVSRAIVATDDRRIFDAVRRAGFEAAMTSSDHQSGSDRLAEVAAGLNDTDIIVNVQGDEPLISPETIERAVTQMMREQEAPVVTTSEPVADAAAVFNADVVKVVTDQAGRALLFSRSPIPYPRNAVHQHGSLERALQNDPQLLAKFRKHTGLYVYRRTFLLEYARWPQSTLEQIESLEQLRVLERGVTIRVVEAAAPSVGVDTPEDLEHVRAIIEKETKDLSNRDA